MSRTPKRQGYQPTHGVKGKPPSGGTAVASPERLPCMQPMYLDGGGPAPLICRCSCGSCSYKREHGCVCECDRCTEKSRYRIAKKGPLYRVEEWRRGNIGGFYIGTYGWRAFEFNGWDPLCWLKDGSNSSTDRDVVQRQLDALRSRETFRSKVEADPEWTPVPEVGAGEG